MKKLRQIIALIASLLAVATSSAATVTASQLVDEAAGKLRNAKSVTITFSASVNQQTQASNGTLLLSGDRFTITSPEAKVWYDGKTQWAWSAASGEVNITEPTIEEIAQVNPYAILNSLRSRYKAGYLGKPSDRTVVLSPSMPDPVIRRGEITFGTDGYPTLMKLIMSSGESVTIRVTSVKNGGEVPLSTFRFSPAKAPGAEIVDLR